MGSHWPLTAFGTIVALVQMALPIVLVRIFPAEVIGTYKVFFLYVSLLPLLSLSAGFPHGLAFWARRDRRLVDQAWSLLVVLVGLIVGLGLLGAPRVDELFGAGATALPFLLSGAALIVGSFVDELWIVEGRVWRVALYRGVSEVVRTGAIIAVGVVTRDFLMLLWAHTVISLAKVAIGAAWAWRGGLRWVADAGAGREVLRYAGPVSVAGFLSSIAGYADQLLLSRMLRPAAFATFSLGCVMLPPLFTLEQSVSQVLTVRVAAHLAEGRKDLAERAYAQGMAELALFMIPSAIALMVFAEPIITLLFTERFAASAPVLRLYAVNYLLLAIPYDVGPKASGDGAWALKTFVVKAGISLTLAYLGARQWGMLGAIAGVLVSGLYLRVAGMWFSVMRLGWRARDFIPWRQLGRAGACAVGLGLAAWWAQGAFSSGLTWLLVGGGGFAGAYGGAVLLPAYWSRLKQHGMSGLHVGSTGR